MAGIFSNTKGIISNASGLSSASRLPAQRQSGVMSLGNSQINPTLGSKPAAPKNSGVMSLGNSQINPTIGSTLPVTSNSNRSAAVPVQNQKPANAGGAQAFGGNPSIMKKTNGGFAI